MKSSPVTVTTLNFCKMLSLVGIAPDDKKLSTSCSHTCENSCQKAHRVSIFRAHVSLVNAQACYVIGIFGKPYASRSLHKLCHWKSKYKYSLQKRKAPGINNFCGRTSYLRQSKHCNENLILVCKDFCQRNVVKHPRMQTHSVENWRSKLLCVKWVI